MKLFSMTDTQNIVLFPTDVIRITLMGSFSPEKVSREYQMYKFYDVSVTIDFFPLLLRSHSVKFVDMFTWGAFFVMSFRV